MRTRSNSFDAFHPAVAAVYFVGVLAFTMAAFHPVYLGVSFVAALAYDVLLRGWRAVARSLIWQLPLVLIVALINPLFSSSGSTVLFRIGYRAVYLESVLYGAGMGVMLVAMIQWFANAACVLTSDKVMALTGRALPTVGLMTVMTMRLAPQFVRRGRAITDVRRACTAVGYASDEGSSNAETTRRSPVFFHRFAKTKASAQEHLRASSVLMMWSMEDSLETADAMRSRGWGAARSRTTYARVRFRARDAAALTVVGALALVTAVFAVSVCEQFSFYPAVTPLQMHEGYVLFAVFMALPFFSELIDRARWRAWLSR